MRLSPLTSSRSRTLYSLLGLVVIASISYGGYFAYATSKELKTSKNELQMTLMSSNETTKLLQDQITTLTVENEELTNFLTEEQKKTLDLEKLKKKNEKKIDTLTKLTTLDPELLKKYSKVFFLSENYNPPKLEDIDEKYKIAADKDLQILEDVSPFLQDMLDDADEDGVNLRVISAYRSFTQQKQLKSNYTVTYGSGANQFSADQGYSEHQLGTTVDFGTPEVTGAYMSFENTTAFAWLKENADRYGFIMSYPKGNSYYQYEPWHWRFVGKDLADDLSDDNKNFYELDQREIDEYLLKIFDK
jgi:LAS superfamily LD-carboxypeptidase LdcB